MLFRNISNWLDAVLDLIGGGSRSTTPVSLNSRKSPTAEMGVQVNQKDGNRRNNNRGQQGGRMDSQGSLENRVSLKHISILNGHFFRNNLAYTRISRFKLNAFVSFPFNSMH